MTQFREIIKNSGLSLAQVAGCEAKEFASVEEWLEYASEREARNVCEANGLVGPELSSEEVERIQVEQRRKACEDAGLSKRHPRRW